jgi:hypothetical protein
MTFWAALAVVLILLVSILVIGVIHREKAVLGHIVAAAEGCDPVDAKVKRRKRSRTRHRLPNCRCRTWLTPILRQI